MATAPPVTSAPRSAVGRDRLIKLGVTAGYLVIVAVLARFSVPCLFLTAFGIPCPGCGMTRALLAVLHGDWIGAAHRHPLVFSLPLLYAYFWFDGRLFGRLPAARPAFGRHADRAVLLTVSVAWLAHWGVEIVLHTR